LSGAEVRPLLSEKGKEGWRSLKLTTAATMVEMSVRRFKNRRVLEGSKKEGRGEGRRKPEFGHFPKNLANKCSLKKKKNEKFSSIRKEDTIFRST
jgi:hypothetical protein